MSSLLFPDNTVLVNFALVGRMDLLEMVAGGGRGAWCGTVARECEQSSREQGLAALTGVRAVLGAPLYPESGAERLEVRHLREELAAPGDRPTEHLGEAETLAIIVSRPTLTGFFVTDDHAAARLARSRGVQVITTWALLRTLHRHGRVSEDEIVAFARVLRAARRAMPNACRSDGEVRDWLHAR